MSERLMAIKVSTVDVCAVTQRVGSKRHRSPISVFLMQKNRNEKKKKKL